MLVSSKGGKDFDPVPAGVHVAVCYSVVDIGSEFSAMYQKWSSKILITWEIPGERIVIPDKDGNDQDLPRVISKTYTATIGAKANLRADLVSWRGRDFTPEEEAGFELKNILGAACQLNVIHKISTSNQKTYANIKAIIPAARGTKLTPENPVVVYDINENGMDIPDSIPQWITEKIQASPEYKELLTPGSQEENHSEAEEPYIDDADIPF